jgi:hypothetical protein
MRSGTSDRYQLKCDVKDEASMVLTFETAHRRYNEHAKCSCVPEGAEYGPSGPGAERRQRPPRRSIKVRCDRAVALGWESSSRLDVFSGEMD